MCGMFLELLYPGYNRVTNTQVTDVIQRSQSVLFFSLNGNENQSFLNQQGCGALRK